MTATQTTHCAEPHRAPTPRVRARVASTLEDARAIRHVLRSAWRVSDSEPYFYSTFNDAESVYRELVEPATKTDDLRQVPAVCLIAEEITGHGDDRRAQVVATASLMFRHEQREIELGRGAILPGARGKQLLWHFLALVESLLPCLSEYVVVADTTLLSRSLGVLAEHVSGPAVAIHPSSFTIQRSTVTGWKRDLVRVHGAEIADALLERSPETGLGRFATAYHVRLPERLKVDRALPRPCLDDIQRPFYEHTRNALGVQPSLQVQRPSRRKMSISDRPLTATRMIVDPPVYVDPAAQMLSARRAGFETVIIQVPCEHHYLATSRRMHTAGGILSGVFPNSSGRWYASYTFLTTAARRAKAVASLQRLHTRHNMPGSYTALLGHIMALYAPQADADATAAAAQAANAQLAVGLADTLRQPHISAVSPTLAARPSSLAAMSSDKRATAAGHKRAGVSTRRARPRGTLGHAPTAFHTRRDEPTAPVSAPVRAKPTGPDLARVRYRPRK